MGCRIFLGCYGVFSASLTVWLPRLELFRGFQNFPEPARLQTRSASVLV